MPFVPLTLILLQIVAGPGPLAEPVAREARPNIGHRLEPAQALTVTYAAAYRHKLDQAGLTAASVDDFDGDGVLDLVCGHAGPSGFSLTLQRGNVDAIQPNAPEARERRERGEFVDQPFHPAARVFELFERPDFVASGDFDADGHRDVVTAADGGSALFLTRGTGRGSLLAPERIDLHGGITAMLSGEINRPDGLADLIVAVVGSEGPAILVFEGPAGALFGKPEIITTDFPVHSLALGQLDAYPAWDLAAAAGDQLIVARGRDRRLSEGDRRREEVGPAEIARLPMAGPIDSVAVGDFVREPGFRQELALLSESGEVQIAKLEQLTSAEARGTALPVVAEIGASRGRAERRSIVTGRVSGQPVEDLLIIGGEADRLIVLTEIPTRPPARSSAAFARSDLPLGDGAVALQPMRLNRDALSDLVIVNRGSKTPQVSRSTRGIGFHVNSNGDTSDASPGDAFCLTSSATCTLRAAIEEANAFAGPDLILFDLAPGSLVITPASDLPAITEAVTIDGTSQPGFSGKPLVELVGTASGVSGSGLVLTGGNIVVSGILVRQFPGDGIQITTNGNNLVEWSFVGTNATGFGFGGNGGHGISVSTDNNTIGGTSKGAPNLLSANGDSGILLGSTGATMNRIQQNWIGTDYNAAGPLPNFWYGVKIDGGVLNEITTRNRISGNSSQGILAEGLSAGMNLIQGNFIGLDRIGTTAIPNGNNGVLLIQGSNTVGGSGTSLRNVISGNTEAGIRMFFGDPDNLVQGNYIGTNASGNSSLPNGDGGIALNGGNFNTIGGTTAGLRNVVSGNAGDGILCQSTGENTILNNYIGIDASGASALANTGFGVKIDDSFNVLLGDDNVISGNDLGGVAIQDTSSFNSVFGNYIGTDATGSAAIPNSGAGIVILRAMKSTIGGATAADRNVISGNTGAGIILEDGAKENEILGNYIGTDAAGTGALANANAGINILDSNDNVVGGTGSDDGNLVAFNNQAGVAVDILAGPTATGNTIRANSIHDNAGLGIDLGSSGVQANDTGDPDTGSNELQNYPELICASSDAAGVIIDGTLNSTPGDIIELEFFATPNCDASGYGEGEQPLGTTGATTDNSGNAIFNASFPMSVSPGGFVTATATSPGLSTSEFSRCFEVRDCASTSMVFSETIFAVSKNTIGWTSPANLVYVKGDVSGLASYTFTHQGTLIAAATLDISTDNPTVGNPRYFMVRPQCCGSWQTIVGTGPGRDPALP